jgi:hypothetical protein
MNNITAVFPGGLLIFAGNILWLGGWALLLNEYFSRVGCGFLGFLGYRPRGGFERFGAGMLAGLGLAGVMFLGLACAGLYSPPVIILALAGAAAGTPGFLRGRPLLLGTLDDCRKMGRLGLTYLGLGILPVLFFLFVPSVEQDSYMYHLGAPAQFLDSHRILVDLVPLTFHYALSIELVYAIPLLLGDDRLASFIEFSSFMAACAMFLGMYGRFRTGVSGTAPVETPEQNPAPEPAPPAAGKGRREQQAAKGRRAQPAGSVREKGPFGLLLERAGKLVEGDMMWVGVLLALSPTVVLSFIGSGKIDVAATSIFIVGMILWEARIWPAAAALFGFCIAAKVAYAPFVAVWMLFRFRSVKVFFLAGMLAALPILPWWFKSWIAVGNPLFPVAQGLFHMWNWDTLNMGAYDTYCAGLVWKDTFTMNGVFGAWFRSMGSEHLAVLLILPGLVIIRSTRMAVLALVLAQLIILRTGHISRYYYPAVMFFSILAAREIPRAFRGGRAILLMVATVALLRIWTFPGFSLLSASYAFMHPRDGFTTRLSAYWSAINATEGFKPRRMLSIGELRTYRLPGRVLYNGFLGETPLVWRMVKDSRDQRELARKFRQTGAQFVFFNYVSTEWTQKYSGGYFSWDRRMFELYKEFCRSRLEYAWDSGSCDYVNGGFYLFRVRSTPLPRPPRVVLLVPGAEAYYYDSFLWGMRNNYDLAIAFMERVVLEQRDVMSFQSELAYLYSRKPDWPSAYKWVQEPVRAGLRNMVCTATYGLAAAATGRYEEAYPVLKEAMVKFVFAGNVVPISMGLVCFGRALNAASRNDPASVEKLLDEGEKALLNLPFPPTKTDRQDVDLRLALLHGLRGDLLAWKGECDKASEMYRDALRLAPGLPGTAVWRERAANPCRGRGRAAVAPAVFPKL